MELVVWGLALYARYVATVLILGASLALVVWLAASIESWSKRRPRSTNGPSE